MQGLEKAVDRRTPDKGGHKNRSKGDIVESKRSFYRKIGKQRKRKKARRGGA